MKLKPKELQIMNVKMLQECLNDYAQHLMTEIWAYTNLYPDSYWIAIG